MTPPTTVGFAIGDAAVEAEARSLLREAGGFEEVLSFPSTTGVLAGVRDRTPDVLLLHEGLGPAPALATARDLLAALPTLAVVLLSRDPTVDMVTAAADAGVRGVVGLPLSLADLQNRMVAAGAWSRRLRDRTQADSGDVDGRVIALAGAKGGVGTTTLAVHLALAASRPGERRACLVDLDLQRGDLTSFLGTAHARSIGDLAEIADELSHANVGRALYTHTSGLHVLLSPRHGEDAEHVTAGSARRIVGLLRTEFPVVVVDCGAVATDASAAVVELADRVGLVTTPDIPSLRAAHELTDLWSRLGVRDPKNVEVVVNRASRRRAVQLGVVRRYAASPVCETMVPANFRAMESEVNEGSVRPEQLHPVARAVRAIAGRWELVPPASSGRRRLRRDAGQATVEFVAVLPFLLGLLMLAVYLVLAGATVLSAQRVAPVAAAAVSAGQEPVAAVLDLLPEVWRAGVRVTSTSGHATVTLRVPLSPVPVEISASAPVPAAS